jgi:anti-sigma factor RsiW
VKKIDCRDVAPQLTGLAEDGAPAPSPEVARHLAECGACRRDLRAQRDVHGLLRARASSLQGRAPETLQARLADQRAARRSWASRSGPLRMPVAATLMLAVLGSLVYGLTGVSSTVLAAQLALDHLKCARFVAPDATVNPAVAMREWTSRYRWTPRMPAPDRTGRATLRSVRRCLYGHGHLAHLMYDVDGRVVSLFVMPRVEHPATATPAAHRLLGQHARVWSESDQTYAMVGDVPAERLASLAGQFRGAE